jgi:hypothetical protein
MNHDEPPVNHDEPPVHHEPAAQPDAPAKDTKASKDEKADKLDEMLTKLPYVNDTLKDIDTRQLFVNGIVVMIRLVANLALALGAVILLAATVKAFGGEQAEGGTKILGGMVVLLGFVPLLLSVMIVNRRSKQIEIAEGSSTIEAVIQTIGTALRMTIEVSAVLVVCNLLIMGLVQFIMGETDAVQYALFSVMEAQSSFMSSGGSEDSSIAPRLFGLVMMAGSIIAGFFVLFGGYFGYDLLKIVYSWFLMMIDFVRRILTNTFHRAKGDNASG